MIRAHNDEAERERRLSKPVLAALTEAGLMRMLTPRSLGVLVFNTAEGWPEKFSAALRAEARAAHTGVVEITIPDLPAGDYAVVALHDENTNKQLDRNWLGVPVEQWGMSNNPPYRFSAPSFEAARFRLEEDLRIRVRLHG